MKTICLILISGILALLGCKSQTKTTANENTSSTTATAELQETYWKLTELKGKPIQRTEENKKEAHIILKKQDNRLQGFAGCNPITGIYTLNEGNGISFYGVVTTLMACPIMETEDGLKRALELADNYTISGNNLLLNKAKMAPLARFEAVYLK